MHTFGRTANNALLKDLMEENSAWINPKVAGEWGIKERTVHLAGEPGWGAVILPHPGQGH